MPSRPPLQSEINPTTSGIIIDPHTGERVVAASKRPDGTLRKEIRIRPGFTPEEDVTRFRSARQQDSDRRALPKGSVVGMARPEVATAQAALRNMSATQRKNARRKEKRKEVGNDEDVPADWDADEGAGAAAPEEKPTQQGQGRVEETTLPVDAPPTPTSATALRSKPSNGGATMFKNALRSAVPTPSPPLPLASASPAAAVASGANGAPAPSATSSRPAADKPERTRTAAGSSGRQGGAKLFGDALTGIGSVKGGEESDPAKKARSLKKKLQQAEQLRDKQAHGTALLPEQQVKVANIPTLEAELAALQL